MDCGRSSTLLSKARPSISSVSYELQPIHILWHVIAPDTGNMKMLTCIVVRVLFSGHYHAPSMQQAMGEYDNAVMEANAVTGTLASQPVPRAGEDA